MQISTRTRQAAAIAIGGTGLLHLALAPEYLSEAAYIGVLFILGGLAALAIAAKLWREDHLPSWALGTLLAVSMAAGFVVSRTVGLPGFGESEWELSGLLSLLLEGGFAAIGLAALRAEAERRRGDQLLAAVGTDAR